MIAGIVASVIVVVAVLTLTITGGTFLPRHYLEPWSKTYYERFDDPRMQLVAHGILAANSHNMQPWRIMLDEGDPDSFLLYADAERLTPQVDPPARQFTISQGTFLEYCAIAGEHLGRGCNITLFPGGEYDAAGTPASIACRPVAQVKLLPGTAATGVLYDCLFLPDTVRTEYEDTPLTEAMVTKLTGVWSDPAVEVTVLQAAADRQHLGSLAIEAAKVEGKATRISEETAAIFRGTEYQKNKYRYGFSVEGQGTSGFGRWLLEGLLAIAPSLAAAGDSNDRFVGQTIAQVAHTPAYVLIKTSDNSRTSQVQAGRAYARVQLTAQSLGLAVQPLSQVLEEYPEMTSLYEQVHAEYATEGQTIQMLMRIGVPTRDVPRSMRRDAADLLAK